MSEYKISIDDMERLMDYQSPVQLAINKWADEIVKQEENCIMAQIKHEIGVEVDKDELIKALDYDREQYTKGFKDGYYKRDAEIVRVKHGKWAKSGQSFLHPEKFISYCCSECGYEDTEKIKYKFCPSCGADMR